MSRFYSDLDGHEFTREELNLNQPPPFRKYMREFGQRMDEAAKSDGSLPQGTPDGVPLQAETEQHMRDSEFAPAIPSVHDPDTCSRCQLDRLAARGDLDGGMPLGRCPLTRKSNPSLLAAPSYIRSDVNPINDYDMYRKVSK